MTWLYLPEQCKNYPSSQAQKVGGSLPSGSVTAVPSATSSVNPTQLTSSNPESQTDGSTMPLSGMTLLHSTGNPGVDAWILSALASLVSHSPTQENEKPPLMTETAGLIPFALLEKSYPHTSSSKMSGDSSQHSPTTAPVETGSGGMMPDGTLFIAHSVGNRFILPQWTLFATSVSFSESWPKAGMMLSGECYLLPKWGQDIGGQGYGLPLFDAGQWPTPTASDNDNRNQKISPSEIEGRHGWGLKSAVIDAESARPYRAWPTKFWLTPAIVQIGTSPDRREKRTAYRESIGRKDVPGSLLEQVQTPKFWPTPTKNDGKGSGKTGKGRDRLDYAVERGIGKPKNTRPLSDHVLKFCPTPNTLDGMNPRDNEKLREWNNSRDGRKNRIVLSNLRDEEKAIPGHLNPDWVEWLMGWPVGWSSLDPLPREQFEDWLNQTATGEWWAGEPPIPRVIPPKSVKNRVGRLKALGNGQVCLQAAVAWDILKKELP